MLRNRYPHSIYSVQHADRTSMRCMYILLYGVILVLQHMTLNWDYIAIIICAPTVHVA